MSDITAKSVRDDLLAEQAELDSLVTPLSEDDWQAPTASERWTVADQIGHLAYFDRTAAWAIADEARFTASLADLAPGLTGEATPDEMDALTLAEFRGVGGDELLSMWRERRRELAAASDGLTDDTRVIWYGPSMSAKSFLTARLMECWAHGQHVADALGIERFPTDRLQHIAQLGFITRGWTYVNRGLEAPSVPVRVELTSPSGATWTYGPDDAEESIVGDAVDFCLVVTQCRHVDATALTVKGESARDWMLKAQAFAGGATDGPSA